MLPITSIKQISEKVWYQTFAFGAFSLFAGSILLQYMFNLQPCPLCIAQRVLFLELGFAFMVFSFLKGTWRALILQLIAISGIIIAGYQTWIQKFPELASTCSGANQSLLEQAVDYLGELYPNVFLATGYCTDTSFQIFGLTFANWGLFIFLAFYIVASKLKSN